MRQISPKAGFCQGWHGSCESRPELLGLTCRQRQSLGGDRELCSWGGVRGARLLLKLMAG